MKANDKIYVSEYLKDLNEKVKYLIDRHYLNADRVDFLTCKELAARCDVTQATITNLTTSSKFFLLYRVAEEIFDAYYAFFSYDEVQAKEKDPDELIYPRDKNYILMSLTSYYSHEFLRG